MVIRIRIRKTRYPKFQISVFQIISYSDIGVFQIWSSDANVFEHPYSPPPYDDKVEVGCFMTTATSSGGGVCILNWKRTSQKWIKFYPLKLHRCKTTFYLHSPYPEAIRVSHGIGPTQNLAFGSSVDGILSQIPFFGLLSLTWSISIFLPHKTLTLKLGFDF